MMDFGIDLIESTTMGLYHGYTFHDLRSNKYFTVITRSSAVNTFINRFVNYPEVVTEQVFRISNYMGHDLIEILKDEYLLNLLATQWIENFNFCDPLFYEY